MIKPFLSLVSLLALCFLSSSCSSLKSPYYIGEKQPMEGLSTDSVWQTGNAVSFVRVVDSNTVVASWVKWDKNSQKHTLSTSPLVLSKLGDTLFLNVKEDDLYTILRIIPAPDGSMVLLTVDSDKVKADIAAKKIKAHTENSDIITDCSKEELDQYVKDNLPTLFDLNSSGVARLISGKLED
jgi:hypothetical protein